MSDLTDVERIAASLPGTTEGNNGGQFAFSVLNKGKHKGFAWTWMERVQPKKPRVPNPGVLAVRVPSLSDKEALLATDSSKFFTEDHYNGFPAVLVRLGAIDIDELEELLVDAWRSQAGSALVAEFDARG